MNSWRERERERESVCDMCMCMRECVCVCGITFHMMDMHTYSIVLSTAFSHIRVHSMHVICTQL